MSRIPAKVRNWVCEVEEKTIHDHLMDALMHVQDAQTSRIDGKSVEQRDARIANLGSKLRQLADEYKPDGR